MEAVKIATGLVELVADLRVPPGAGAVVVLAYAGGPLPRDLRDGPVRDELAFAGIATLVVDLLTADERHLGPRPLSPQVGELAERLGDAIDVATRHPEAPRSCPGCFATDTAAAAAFLAAARRPATVGAIVSHEGRTDFVGGALEEVMAPTLLVVGSEEHAVRDLNEEAYGRLRCRKRIELVLGATLSPTARTRALEAVGRLAAEWFRRFLLGPEARR